MQDTNTDITLNFNEGFKRPFFWKVTLNTQAEVHMHFGGMYCVGLKDQNTNRGRHMSKWFRWRYRPENLRGQRK
jgi:hypothetical protein